MKPKWKHGDKQILAQKAGISRGYLANILHGRRTCPPALAQRLATFSKVLGYDMPRELWVFPDMRQGNPLFPRVG